MIIFASQQLTNGNALDETKMPQKIEMSRRITTRQVLQLTVLFDQPASARVLADGLPQRLRADIGYCARMSSKAHSFGVGTTRLRTAYCYLYLSMQYGRVIALHRFFRSATVFTRPQLSAKRVPGALSVNTSPNCQFGNRRSM